MNNETFGKKLRWMRNNHDWTLRELAAKVGINFAYLSQLEAGLVKPSVELVEKLSNMFSLKDRDREEFIFSAREIRQQLKNLHQSFPNFVPQYVCKVPKQR